MYIEGTETVSWNHKLIINLKLKKKKKIISKNRVYNSYLKNFFFFYIFIKEYKKK